MEIRLANPRGFCAGVDRAIAIVERALSRFGPPVYVRHDVVHNRSVVEGLARQGAIFVETLDAVPEGATLVFSAHGVPRAVRARAAARGFHVFDATCPLVTKVHVEISRYLQEGRECILVGHAGHPEVEGTLGQRRPGQPPIHLVETVEDVDALEIGDPSRLAFVTQTTLSMDDTACIVDTLRRRFPGISGPRKKDICYATQNRQDAVKGLAPRCDLFLVVGSASSSNSNRLREVASRLGTPARQIDNADELRREWFEGVARVGVTAGASAPETLVREVVARLVLWGGRVVEEAAGASEDVVFSLPRGLT